MRAHGSLPRNSHVRALSILTRNSYLSYKQQCLLRQSGFYFLIKIRLPNTIIDIQSPIHVPYCVTKNLNFLNVNIE